jgi:peptide/nickel transport system substrate-binding protein
MAPNRTPTLRRTRLLVASALAGSMLLASCGGDPAGEAGPKVLNLSMPAPAVSLDPAAMMTTSMWATTLAYDSLIGLNPKGEMVPALAESWGYVGNENKEFEIKLRSGVKFSDGTELNADVVIANLEHYREEAPQGAKLNNIQTMTAVDPLTVNLKLAKPQPNLTEYFTPPKGAGAMASGEALKSPDKMATQSFGAGPYVLDPASSVAKDTYTYVPNKHYWSPGTIHWDKVVLKVIENPNTVLAALKSRQLDLATGDFTTAAAAKAAGLDVQTIPRQWFGVTLADREGKLVKALGDVRVRQALNYAVNRQKIVDGLLAPYGIVSDQIMMPGQPGYQDKPFYTYDVAKAKQLLAEAGYPNGFDLAVTTQNKRGIGLVTQAIVDDWKQIGIKVNLTTDPDQGTYSPNQVSGKWPVFGLGYGTDGDIHYMTPAVFQPTGKTWNPLGTSDPNIDRMFTEAAANPDENAREGIYKQMIGYLVEQAWFVPVALLPNFFYARDTVRGLELSPNNQFAAITYVEPAV